MRSLAALLALIIFCCVGESAWANRRVALVIGNSSYVNVASLPNPANDAAAVAELFKAAGFDIVESRRDLKNAELRRVLNNFFDSARDADFAVVYYAGHGIEIDGSNYIVPVDALLERDRDVYDETISLDRIVQSIEQARQLRLVILDACRENPFAQSMKRTLATRGISRGLARVDPITPNTLVAFAAKAGSTAEDGRGKHSPFTAAILNHLTTPGLDLRKAFGIIRDDVMAATNNKQEPYVFGSLGGADVALVPAPVVPVALTPSAQEVTAEVRREYEFAERIATKEAWDYFLQAHSSGFYADLAKAQRNKLTAEEARIAATQQAKVALDEQIRLAVEGALASEQAKAAAKTKAAEEARLAAEKKSEDAKAIVATQAVAPAKVASLSDAPPPVPINPTPNTKIPELPPNVIAPGREPSAKEAADWDRVKDSSDPSALQKFIKLHPDSPLSIKAQERFDILKKTAQEREDKARAEREAAKKAEEEARIRTEQQKAEAAAAKKREEEERRAKAAEAEQQAKAAEAERKAAEETARKAAEEARIQAEQQKAEAAAAKKREEDERRAKAAEAAKAAETERKSAEEAARKAAEKARIQTEQQKAETAAAKKREDDERRAKAAEAAKATEAAKAAEAERQAQEARQKAEEAAKAKAAADAEAERKKAELVAAQEATCKREQGALDDLITKGSDGSGVEDLKAFNKTVTCNSLKPLVVAALDKFTKEAAKRAAALPNSPELIRSAQTQLVRLGCFADKVDGVLGDNTKSAVSRYLSIKSEAAGDGAITEGLVTELTGQTGRICQPECKSGQELKGETCVAVAKPSAPTTASRHKTDDEDIPARHKPARRQADREQPRPARPAQEAPRARQEAVAPGAGGGGSRPVVGVGF